MHSSPFLKAGILTIVVTTLFILFLEWYWRSRGFPISYNDDEALWADKRSMVYEPIDQTTVVIGSSRIKFDLDVPLFEQSTGDHAIQLAMVGSTPKPVLENLANDKNFKGKVIIDITEGSYFSRPGARNERLPLLNIAYYKKITPAQKASFVLNHGLESQFVLLQKNTFSLNAMLERIPIKERPNLISMAFPKFPLQWSFVDFNRQTIMGERMITDTNMQNQVKKIWLMSLKIKPMRYDSSEQVMYQTKIWTDKIRQRGGQIIFVRTPSSGFYREAERKTYPRTKYWDRLLAITQCPGIHFEDYPEIKNIQCPEGSHLAGNDRILFTRWLVGALREKGWSFKHSQLASNNQ